MAPSDRARALIINGPRVHPGARSASLIGRCRRWGPMDEGPQQTSSASAQPVKPHVADRSGGLHMARRVVASLRPAIPISRSRPTRIVLDPASRNRRQRGGVVNRDQTSDDLCVQSVSATFSNLLTTGPPQLVRRKVARPTDARGACRLSRASAPRRGAPAARAARVGG